MNVVFGTITGVVLFVDIGVAVDKSSVSGVVTSLAACSVVEVVDSVSEVVNVVMTGLVPDAKDVVVDVVYGVGNNWYLASVASVVSDVVTDVVTASVSGVVTVFELDVVICVVTCVVAEACVVVETDVVDEASVVPEAVTTSAVVRVSRKLDFGVEGKSSLFSPKTDVVSGRSCTVDVVSGSVVL